uniref:Uncharacterized protein n=1 Tax=Magallana gigas TaxID=29159 RepID=A0A8W8MDJ3_MAGGI
MTKKTSQVSCPSHQVLHNVLLHLLRDTVYISTSLTKTSEGKDVDLSIIEPRVSATITTLKRMEEKDAPFTSRAASVAEN